MSYNIIKTIASTMLLGVAVNAQAQLDYNLQTGATVQQANDNMLLAQRTSRGSSSSGSSSSSSTSNSRDRVSNNSSSSNSSSSSSNERPTRPARTPSQPKESKADNRHTPTSSNRHEHQDNSSHESHSHHHRGHTPPPPPPSNDVIYVESTPYVGSSTYEDVEDDYVLNTHTLSISLGVNFTSRDVYSEYLNDDTNEANAGYVGGIRYDYGPQFIHPVYMSIGANYSKQSYTNNFDAYNHMTNEKRMIEIPLHVGIRMGVTEKSFIGAGVGPIFCIGLNGKCKETYDFRDEEHPNEDYGTFTHNSYGGKYGISRFRAGVGAEIYVFLNRFFLSYNLQIYPGDDCEPKDLYLGLFDKFDSRINNSFKIGYKIF